MPHPLACVGFHVEQRVMCVPQWSGALLFCVLRYAPMASGFVAAHIAASLWHEPPYRQPCDYMTTYNKYTVKFFHLQDHLLILQYKWVISTLRHVRHTLAEQGKNVG